MYRGYDTVGRDAPGAPRNRRGSYVAHTVRRYDTRGFGGVPVGRGIPDAPRTGARYRRV